MADLERGARRAAADELALERGLLQAIAAFRWTAWAWMATVAAIDLRNGPVAHPATIVALVLLALAVTVTATVVVRTHPEALLAPAVLAGELAVALVIVGADHWVYGATSDHAQSLGSIWPLAAVLSIGVRYGGRGGVLAGLAVGLAAWLGEATVVPGPWSLDRVVGSMGTVVLYALGGGVAGLTAVRLREARREIALARAREEVARTLHDGVLQTLAVVQRRAGDPSLARLARDQERELRQFLFGGLDDDGGGDPVVALRAAATRAGRTHDLPVEVAAAPDLPEVDPAVVRALAGAVSEALTNAAKHGAATRATVHVDLDDADADGGDVLVCSVKDDGTGFDVATTVEGEGLRGSVRGRLAEVGGRVEVYGRPGRGAEVRLWAPVRPAATTVGPHGAREDEEVPR